MAKPIYSTKILGDSPAWARRKRDCLKQHFAKRRISAVVTATGSNVNVRLYGQVVVGSYYIPMLRKYLAEQEMPRAERACKI